jgi:alpha-tubulin suppressor-like RCC1 family protein
MGLGRQCFYQLGDNTLAVKRLPTQIGTDNSWSNISAGNSHSLAIKTNGTL